MAHSLLNFPVVPVSLTLISLLVMHKALMHQFLDLLHLLDLLSTSSTALDPVQQIHRHSNHSPIYYLC